MKPQCKCSIWYYKNNKKKLSKGLYIEDDDYTDWISCVQVEEKQRIQDFANNCFEFPSQFFLVLPSRGRESKNEEDMWIEMKENVHLNTSLNEK